MDFDCTRCGRLTGVLDSVACKQADRLRVFCSYACLLAWVRGHREAV